jgi:hypothetical protein
MAESKPKPPPKEKKPNRPPSWPGALSKAKIQRVMLATVVGIDGGLSIANNYTRGHFWEQGEPPLGDRLTVEEIALLANASAEEAARHPRLLRVIDRIVRLGGQAGFAGALVIVAIPRLTRRHILPAGLQMFIENLLTAASAQTTDEQGNVVNMPGQESEQAPDRNAAS